MTQYDALPHSPARGVDSVGDDLERQPLAEAGAGKVQGPAGEAARRVQLTQLRREQRPTARETDARFRLNHEPSCMSPPVE